MQMGHTQRAEKNTTKRTALHEKDSNTCDRDPAQNGGRELRAVRLSIYSQVLKQLDVTGQSHCANNRRYVGIQGDTERAPRERRF